MPPTTRGSLNVAGIQISAATSTPARIASPPSSGVSRVPRPRSRIFDTAPTRLAKRAASGVNSIATAIAAKNANTASQRIVRAKDGSRGGSSGGQPIRRVLSASAWAMLVITAIGPSRSWIQVTRMTR